MQYRRTPDGPIENRIIDIVGDDDLRMLSSATEKSLRVSVRIGYLRGWTMLTRQSTGGPAEVLRSALNGEFADVRAVIFDARGRIGGGAADALEAYFGPRITMSTKGQKNNQWIDHPVMPAGKPLIIIIDQHTRSAAEIMTYMAKRDKLALLVGSRMAVASMLRSGRSVWMVKFWKDEVSRPMCWSSVPCPMPTGLIRSWTAQKY